MARVGYVRTRMDQYFPASEQGSQDVRGGGQGGGGGGGGEGRADMLLCYLC